MILLDIFGFDNLLNFSITFDKFANISMLGKVFTRFAFLET